MQSDVMSPLAQRANSVYAYLNESRNTLVRITSADLSAKLVQKCARLAI